MNKEIAYFLYKKNNKQLIKKNIYIKLKSLEFKLLNPTIIIKWSNGEVKRADTVDYKTFFPKKNGLFCASIFGPINDYECLCGHLKGHEYKNKICDICNVKVTTSRMRKYTMGHINLISPVPHYWFLYSNYLLWLIDSTYGNEINFSKRYRNLKELLRSYPESYYIKLQDMNVVHEYINVKKKLIKKKYINLSYLKDIDIHKNNTIYDQELIILTRKLRIFSFLILSKQRPEWLLQTKLLVLPVDLRPLLKIDNKILISSDLNYLYRAIIYRNIRLQKLLKMQTNNKLFTYNTKEANYIKDEKKMLQEAVYSLYDKNRLKNKDYNSLLQTLSGKEGRFRNNLLGKRTDYSARSVITSGSRLKLNECGIPIEIALELFKPFLYARLYKINITNANELINLIQRLIIQHPILLNRAPTLHRLNIQAFTPILINGKSIQLHPLVCSSFNADFDGDTMSIHIPFTLNAQIESRLLMSTSNNILSPMNSKPIIAPSQDIVFGIYYCTKNYSNCNNKANIKRIDNLDTLKTLYRHEDIELNDEILYRKGLNNYYKTTVGRILFLNIIPIETNIDIGQYNITYHKKDIIELINNVYQRCEKTRFNIFIDQLMAFGFYYAYKSGISFHLKDIIIPTIKGTLLRKVKNQINRYNIKYISGVISKEERDKTEINAWTKSLNILTKEISKDITHTSNKKQPFIYMLIDSGARGSMIQMRQLAGMRGLMIKPSGDILGNPILSNFKEGLSLIEYFNSIHGARKGVIDTSIKTAASGYLTRKLVNATKNTWITEYDCKTTKGILVEHLFKNDIIISSLSDRVYGRYLAKDVINPLDNKCIIKKGTLLTNHYINTLKKYCIEYVYIRSILTCQSSMGICQKCYGLDLSNNQVIALGDPIGILSAQSIGEPGTQLTMRTFHLGGTVMKSSEQANISSNYNARILIKNKKMICNKINQHYINISRQSEIILVDYYFNIKAIYKIPYGAIIYKEDGSEVYKNEIIAKWNPYQMPIININNGLIHYNNMLSNDNIKEIYSDNTGLSKYQILDDKKKPSVSTISITNSNIYENKSNTIKLYRNDYVYNYKYQKIISGWNIGYIPLRTTIMQDITGGLSKITQIFEAVQTNKAIISDVEGISNLYKKENNKWLLSIHNRNRKEHIKKISNINELYIRDNSYLYKGDIISNGILPIHDYIDIMGFEKGSRLLLEQIESIYIDNGVGMNEKHIEVVLRLMFNQITEEVEITNRKNKNKKIDITQYYKNNLNKLVIGNIPCKGIININGVSNVGLNNISFLSAASFQKVSYVLTNASLWNFIDNLMGLQQQMFFGHLIPIGTGSIEYNKKDNINANN